MPKFDKIQKNKKQKEIKEKKACVPYDLDNLPRAHRKILREREAGWPDGLPVGPNFHGGKALKLKGPGIDPV